MLSIIIGINIFREGQMFVDRHDNMCLLSVMCGLGAYQGYLTKIMFQK
jgi:hypothetical protein